MSDQPTLIPMDVKVVNQIVVDRDRLATALGECAAAATKGAQQWLEEVNRLTAELSSYHAGLVHALGLPEDASKTDVVEAAARAWSYTQRHVEGVLVDEGVTELPGAWTQDDGPPVRPTPRTWSTAGSEPPWSVTVLFDPEQRKYLCRLPHDRIRWNWYQDPEDRFKVRHAGALWSKVREFDCVRILAEVADDPTPAEAVSTDGQ